MILTEDEVYYVSGSLLDVLGHDLDHERVEKLRASHEELRQRAETAERELAADLPYRERWQQARDEIKALRKRVEDAERYTRTLEDDITQINAAVDVGNTRIADLESKLAEAKEIPELLLDGAVELAGMLREKWAFQDRDMLTLYLTSFMAGLNEEWRKQPPENGFTVSAEFPEGRLQIEVRRIEGKSAAEVIKDLQSKLAGMKQEKAIEGSGQWPCFANSKDDARAIAESYTNSGIAPRIVTRHTPTTEWKDADQK